MSSRAPRGSGSGSGSDPHPARASIDALRRCGACGRPPSAAWPLKKCAACKAVVYCGSACQRVEGPQTSLQATAGVCAHEGFQEPPRETADGGGSPEGGGARVWERVPARGRSGGGCLSAHVRRDRLRSEDRAGRDLGVWRAVLTGLTGRVHGRGRAPRDRRLDASGASTRWC